VRGLQSARERSRAFIRKGTSFKKSSDGTYAQTILSTTISPCMDVGKHAHTHTQEEGEEEEGPGRAGGRGGGGERARASTHGPQAESGLCKCRCLEERFIHSHTRSTHRSRHTPTYHPPTSTHPTTHLLPFPPSPLPTQCISAPGTHRQPPLSRSIASHSFLFR
jgi:hypothetical protein